MKTLKLSIILCLTLLLAIGCGAADQQQEGGTTQDQSITFGMTPWTSTIPPTTIAMLLLEEMGFEVNQIEADAGGV